MHIKYKLIITDFVLHDITCLNLYLIIKDKFTLLCIICEGFNLLFLVQTFLLGNVQIWGWGRGDSNYLEMSNAMSNYAMLNLSKKRWTDTSDEKVVISKLSPNFNFSWGRDGSISAYPGTHQPTKKSMKYQL